MEEVSHKGSVPSATLQRRRARRQPQAFCAKRLALADDIAVPVANFATCEAAVLPAKGVLRLPCLGVPKIGFASNSAIPEGQQLRKPGPGARVL